MSEKTNCSSVAKAEVFYCLFSFALFVSRFVSICVFHSYIFPNFGLSTVFRIVRIITFLHKCIQIAFNCSAQFLRFGSTIRIKCGGSLSQSPGVQASSSVPGSVKYSSRNAFRSSRFISSTVWLPKRSLKSARVSSELNQFCKFGIFIYFFTHK